jgi:hemerythrin superfamily protein
MKALLSRLAPRATDMIRADHTRVVGLFHRYSIYASPATKEALVGSVCLMLEVHAQVEEEIFYPAMRALNSTLVEASVPEHEEIRRRIAMLRELDPASDAYDLTFMELMRNVLHHVADEETMLLPQAETSLGERLGELGARMAKRRLQLTAPHAGQLAINKARGMSTTTMVVAAGAVIAGAVLLSRRGSVR